MAVNATYTPAQYTGNAVTTAFSFPYQYFAAADLIVNLFDTTAGTNVSPQPVLNGGATYDYTVAGVSGFSYPTNNVVEFASATITFNNAPPANYRITLTRAVPQTQGANLLDNAKLPASSVNAALDRTALWVQQLQSGLGFAITAPTNDPTGLTYTLPVASVRANNLIGCDALGNIVATSVANAAVLNLAGQAANMIRVNAGATDFDFRTPAQVRGDIGADNATNLTSGTVADARLPTTMAGKTLTSPTLTAPTLTTATITDYLATISIKDALFTLGDDGDTTKQMRFQLSGLTTATTRTLTVQDANYTLIGRDTTDTLTNKTFDTAGTGNVLKINGTTISAVTGTGSNVLATAPAMTNVSTDRLTVTGSTAPSAEGLYLPAAGTVGVAIGGALVTSITSVLLKQHNGANENIVLKGSAGQVFGSGVGIEAVNDAANANVNFELRGGTAIGLNANNSSGSVRFLVNSVEQARVTATASASNILQMTGSNGGAPSITTSGGNLSLQSAAGLIQFGSAGSFTANGAVATVLGSVGATGSHTTVQEWLTFVNSGGTTRYVPCF